MPRRPASIKSRIKGKRTNYTKYLGIFGVFILCLGFFTFYSFFKQFSKACIFAETETSSQNQNEEPFKNAYSIALLTLENSFDSSPLNLSKIELFVVAPDSSGGILIDIPVDTVLDMPGKYGEEKLSSALALGTLNSSTIEGSCNDACFKESMSFVLSSLKLLAGTSIDKWVLVESALSNYSEDLLFEGKSMSFFDRNNILLLDNSMKTNFTFSEFLHHYGTVRSLDQAKIKNITFSGPDLLDTNLRELNYNSVIATEKLSIAVLNATAVPGVASFGARVAKNIGGHVTSVENAPQTVEKTFVVTNSLDSFTIKYLKDFFNIEDIYSKEDAPFTDSSMDRADLTLILGLDFLPNY
jgi:hypothetical protein